MTANPSEETTAVRPTAAVKPKDFEPEDRPGRPADKEVSLDKYFSPEAKGIMARMSGKVSEFTTRLYEKVAQSEKLSGGIIERNMGSLATRMDIWFHKKLEQGALKAKTRDTKGAEHYEKKAKRLAAESESADQDYAKMQEIAQRLDLPLNAKTGIVFADKKKEIQDKMDALAKQKEEGAQRVADAEGRYKEYRADIEKGVARLTDHAREKIRGNTWEVMENMTGVAAMEQAVKEHGEIWKTQKEKMELAQKSLLDPSLGAYREQLKEFLKAAEKGHSEASAAYTSSQDALKKVRAKIEKLLGENKSYIEGIQKIDEKYLSPEERKMRAEERVKELEEKVKAGDLEGALKIAQTTGDFELVRRVSILAANSGDKEAADYILLAIPESERSRAKATPPPIPAAAMNLALGGLRKANPDQQVTKVAPAPTPAVGGRLPPPPPARRSVKVMPTGTPKLAPVVPITSPAEAVPSAIPETGKEEEPKTFKGQVSDFMIRWNAAHTGPGEELSLKELESDEGVEKIEDADELAMAIKNVLAKNNPSRKISLTQILEILPQADIFNAAA